MAHALREHVFTSALTARSTVATGCAPTWAPIRTTAVDAARSVRKAKYAVAVPAAIRRSRTALAAQIRACSLSSCAGAGVLTPLPTPTTVAGAAMSARRAGPARVARVGTLSVNLLSAKAAVEIRGSDVHALFQLKGAIMTHQWDEFTKSLAEKSLPRRQSLRLLGAALASAVFSPLSTAWGAIDPCKAFCNQCPQSKRSQCLSACRACNGNTFHLTKAALAKLAATCESKGTRELTIVVDGKHWGGVPV